jgi:hypothetical protein
MLGSSGDNGQVVRAVSLSLVVRSASVAAAANPPVAEADLSPAVRAFITQSLVNRHAAIGQEMLAQLPDQRSFLVECVAALPSSTQSNSRQNQQQQELPNHDMSSGDAASTLTSQMAALSITAEPTPSHLPRVYFVDDNTRFVWLAKVPQSTTAAAAAASDSSSSGDLPMEPASHDSNQTPSVNHIPNQNQNQNPKPAAADAFAAIGGLGAQIEVR